MVSVHGAPNVVSPVSLALKVSLSLDFEFFSIDYNMQKQSVYISRKTQKQNYVTEYRVKHPVYRYLATMIHERQNEPIALMTITNLALHNQTLYTMAARPHLLIATFCER